MVEPHRRLNERPPRERFERPLTYTFSDDVKVVSILASFALKCRQPAKTGGWTFPRRFIQMPNLGQPFGMEGSSWQSTFRVEPSMRGGSRANVCSSWGLGVDCQVGLGRLVRMWKRCFICESWSRSCGMATGCQHDADGSSRGDAYHHAECGGLALPGRHPVSSSNHNHIHACSLLEFLLAAPCCHGTTLTDAMTLPYPHGTGSLQVAGQHPAGEAAALACVAYSWGEDLSVLGEAFDLVLGADIIYAVQGALPRRCRSDRVECGQAALTRCHDACDQHRLVCASRGVWPIGFTELCWTLRELFKAGRPRVLLAYEHRWRDIRDWFLEELEQVGLGARDLDSGLKGCDPSLRILEVGPRAVPSGPVVDSNRLDSEGISPDCPDEAPGSPQPAAPSYEGASAGSGEA
jgi:hypothetical protein